MCGICGLVGDFSAGAGLKTVQRMNETMFHRGPDDEGAWSHKGVAFAMRRLSIIDIGGGQQPKWSGGEDGKGIGIVFNGEIYNHDKLRESLQNRGYHFSTRSDTEVILRLYEAEGLAGISKLEGMFGICLFDPARNQLHLVRDRMGIKPLYFAELEGQFLFASEIKSILTALKSKPAINMDAVSHFLTFRFVPSEMSIWQGVNKLAPGSILTLDINTKQYEISKYWGLQFESEDIDRERNYLSEFDDLFTNSVEKRLLNSDAPVGVLLSGGLDSSALSAAAVAAGHKDFHTFSVAFDDKGEFSEHAYAKVVADHLGSRHHELSIGQGEFIDFLPDFVKYTDEPIADLASIPLFYLSKMASKDVKVVLSGEGSDEILAGYSFETMAATLDKLKQIDRFTPRFALKIASSLMSGNKALAFAALAEGGLEGYQQALGSHMTWVWGDEEKAGLLKTSNSRGSSRDLLSSWYAKSESKDPLDQIQDVYCGGWLIEDLLMKADRMSMAASLELRVPFLDHHLVEWAAKLPKQWKVGNASVGYSSKRILREYAKKYLPQEILDRPKQGFPVPAYIWLQGKLGSDIANRLTSSERLGELVNMAPVREAVIEAQNGSIKAAHKVWALMILDHWLEAWA